MQTVVKLQALLGKLDRADLADLLNGAVLDLIDTRWHPVYEGARTVHVVADIHTSCEAQQRLDNLPWKDYLLLRELIEEIYSYSGKRVACGAVSFHVADGYPAPVRALTATGSGCEVPIPAEGSAPDLDGDSADAGTGHARVESARVNASDSPCVFRKRGDVWEVSYGGTAAYFKDLKGMRYINFLLGCPRQEFHVLNLVTQVEKPELPWPEPYYVPTDRELRDHGLSVEGLTSAGEIMDAKSLRDVRETLTTVQQDLAQAERFNDPERCSQLRKEKDLLISALSEAVGLGGRSRESPNPIDRARKMVSQNVRRALGKFSEEHLPIYRHLRHSVHLGQFVSYDPEDDPDWLL